MIRAPQSRPTPMVGRLAGSRILNASQIADLQRARAAGARVVQLAEQYGVSRRTIYRWLGTRIVSVTIEGWTARFALREGYRYRDGPVQIEEWRDAS